ncbi:FAD-dependent oxidoreductase [Prosthecomicrobium sp. N25]|uniref:FAD-dependent oxidoreductase n=1 Tax=Prosthecomicrobium sp. N25 TaxID=3129254 RepID=UPI003077021B
MENRPTETCDVLIVGGGGAGLTAAVTAAERGMRVILLERRDRLGGSTAIAIGSISAAGTRWQKRKGIADRVDDFLEDMAAFPGVKPETDAPALRAVLATEAGRALEWLRGLGVPFVGPFPEPPHRVPRMHNVVPDSRMYIACLARAAHRHGVDIRLGCEVDGLLEDEEGAVCGALVRQAGADRRFMAERGVILAAGDFSGNAEMRRRYLPPAAADSIPANPESTGKGHLLGLQMGAELKGMDVSTGPKLRFRSRPAQGILSRLPLWPPLMQAIAAVVQLMPDRALRPFVKSLLVVHMQPSPALFEQGAILVDLRGERFCNEAQGTLSLAHRPEAAGYIILNEAIAEQFRRAPYYLSTAPGIGYAYFQDYERARPELICRAPSTELLAAALRLDPARLEASIRSKAEKLSPPFVALGPVVSTVTVTEGGLSVDDQCRVLKADGSPVERLFGVGGAAQSGMRLSGHGLHIGWAVVSGRIAGRSASQLIPRSGRNGRWAPALATTHASRSPTS